MTNIKIKAALLIHLLLLAVCMTTITGTGIVAYEMACYVAWTGYFASGFTAIHMAVPIIVKRLSR